MLTKKQNFKIRSIIFSIALIIVIISFSVTAVVLFKNTSGFLKSKITNSNYSNLSQISKRIEICFSEVENVTKRIAQSYVLKEYLDQYKSKKHIAFENVYLTKQISNFLKNSKIYTEGIIDSILFVTPEEHFYVGENSDKGHVAIDYKTLINSSFCKSLNENPEKPVLLYLDEDIIEYDKFNTNKDNILVKGSTLFALKSVFNNQLYGIVLIKINDNWINNILQENSMTAIIDNSSILWKGEQIGEIPVENIVSRMENRDEGIIEWTNRQRLFYNKLSWGEWYLLYFEELEGVQRLRSFGYYLIISFVISIVISVVISKFTLNKLIEPLNNLIESVRKYKSEEDTGGFVAVKNDKRSIRERILLYYFMVIIIPLAFLVFSYFLFSENTIQNELIQSEKTAFNQTSENISLYMEKKLKAISSMSYDRTIQDALVSDPENINKNKLYAVVNSYMLLANGYDDITINNINGDMILSTYNNNKDYYSAKAELQAWNLSSDKIEWINSRKDELGRFILKIVIKVRGYDLDYHYKKYLLEDIGDIEINLEEDELEQIYRDIYLKSNAKTLIVDRQGRIVSSIDKGLIGLNYNGLRLDKSSNSRVITFEKDIEGTPWVFIGEYDYKDILNEFTQILYYIALILIVIVLFLIIVSYEISYRLANSLTRINKAMSDMDYGGLGYELPDNSHISEIAELASTFNEMVTRIDTLIDDLIITKNKQRRLEMEKRDVEIYALQSQIKPHFLCNTLESIRCLVKEKKEDSAVEMLKDLSDLFRYGISKVENLIPIEQELAHAAAYTRIMSKRFKNINFKWEIEEETKNYYTPKMLLQPIIENAVYHGIVPHIQDGEIIISSRLGEEGVIFSITDNGVGMSKTMLEELNERLEKSDSNRVGLENVYKRLKLYFGDKARLNIESLQQKGTTVTIVIPVISDDYFIHLS